MQQLDNQLNNLFGDNTDWKKQSIVHERLFVKGNDVIADDEKDVYTAEEFLKELIGQGVRAFINPQGQKVNLADRQGLVGTTSALKQLFPNGIRADVIKNYKFELQNRALTSDAIRNLKALNDKQPEAPQQKQQAQKGPAVPSLWDVRHGKASASAPVQSTLTKTGVR